MPWGAQARSWSCSHVQTQELFSCAVSKAAKLLLVGHSGSCCSGCPEQGSPGS